MQTGPRVDQAGSGGREGVHRAVLPLSDGGDVPSVLPGGECRLGGGVRPGAGVTFGREGACVPCLSAGVSHVLQECAQRRSSRDGADLESVVGIKVVSLTFGCASVECGEGRGGLLPRLPPRLVRPQPVSHHDAPPPRLEEDGGAGDPRGVDALCLLPLLLRSVFVHHALPLFELKIHEPESAGPFGALSLLQGEMHVRLIFFPYCLCKAPTRERCFSILWSLPFN